MLAHLQGVFGRSTDSGQNWQQATDFLTNLGVSDIAVHPTNPDTFIITGDRDGGDTYSYGVMKSMMEVTLGNLLDFLLIFHLLYKGN